MNIFPADCEAKTKASPLRRNVALRIAPLIFAVGLGSCSSVPLTEAGSLRSYSKLGPVEGRVSKSRSFLDTSALATATSVAITPTRLSPLAYSRIHDAGNDRLVSNALDRALCVDLSDKFRVVGPGERADITVQAVITDIVPTSKTAAGLSTVATLATSVVLPVGVPRLPVGLGGLAVEAEAIDGSGIQRAAIVWSRGANSITNGARVSEVGDAYSLASSFAAQFSDMLVKNRKPSGLDLSLPSGQKLKSQLGGKPKNAACEAFGRAPGIAGALAGVVGAPPSWTDKASKR
ncbi:DUF3313 domain-containing protein [Allorhizobium taibaishanense]|uniref:DUF3313 domain-containing protein n=1 Tax=Allorhizobium taibaishanense TaxID=887144 RepID=A0A1Q9A9E9_9HYPH|nr:DUF3313 domain-containing protein [Allorhizobium taibaishanense]MBB4009775.1 hypothetical protein [Allorhizobium taibaishanense]OLP51428.1 hypothetical protein BJF91_15310 [Allorhizobium taibaishanense]